MVTIWIQIVTISSLLLLRRNCVLFCSCIFKKISLFFSHLRGVEQQADNEHAAAISEDRIDNADEVAEAHQAGGKGHGQGQSLFHGNPPLLVEIML